MTIRKVVYVAGLAASALAMTGCLKGPAVLTAPPAITCDAQTGECSSVTVGR